MNTLFGRVIQPYMCLALVRSSVVLYATKGGDSLRMIVRFGQIYLACCSQGTLRSKLSAYRNRTEQLVVRDPAVIFLLRINLAPA